MNKELSDDFEYSWISYAKGIGIILVVYGHVARGVFNAGMIQNESLFKLVDGVIYSFHMPLFFFISGLFFCKSVVHRGVNGLLIRKLSTLVYPYFLWSLVQGGIGYVADPITNFSIRINDLYSIPWAPIDQFWFLYALFLIFFLVSIAYKFTSNVIYLFLFSLALLVFNDYFSSPWEILNIASKYAVYFCGGVVFSKYMGSTSKIGVAELSFCCVVFILAQWACFDELVAVNYWRYGGVLIAFSAIVCVVALSQKLSSIGLKALKIIGRNSLEIYLMHVLFASGFRIVMHKFLGIDSSSFHLLIGTLVGVFMSIVFVHYTRRLGMSFLFVWPTSPKSSAAPPG